MTTLHKIRVKMSKYNNYLWSLDSLNFFSDGCSSKLSAFSWSALDDTFWAVNDVSVSFLVTTGSGFASAAADIPENIDPRASRRFFSLSLTLAVLFMTASTWGRSIVVRQSEPLLPKMVRVLTWVTRRNQYCPVIAIILGPRTTLGSLYLTVMVIEPFLGLEKRSSPAQ